MIVVQLKGGIGNQLFQYAAAKALATHHRVPLKLDVSSYQQDTLRGFELGNFNVDVELATEMELARFKQGVLGKIRERLLPHYRRTTYKEQDFSFDRHFLQARPDVYLKGYWQSEKYFLPIQEPLRKAFVLKPELISSVIELGNKMAAEESVAIHIRRGDYVKPEVIKVHGVIPAAYYAAAIKRIAAQVNVSCLYIFTDDEQWVKQYLPLTGNYVFVSNEFTSTHYEDFYLMSRCRHNIIANSSFSWWAAWLNDHAGKIVVAPHKWFNQAPHDIKDLFPVGWVSIHPQAYE